MLLPPARLLVSHFSQIMKISNCSSVFLTFIFAAGAHGQTTTSEELPTMVVTGKAESLIGEAESASQGQTSAKELEDRPLLRRGELLESMRTAEGPYASLAYRYFSKPFDWTLTEDDLAVSVS